MVSAPDRDARHVAAAELYEAAEAIETAGRILREFIEAGDVTGARRQLLMSEAALIRAKVAWTLFDSIIERRAA